MKKHFRLISVFGILLLFFGCDIGPTINSFVLPNGTIISQAEKDTLDALETSAYACLEEITGSEISRDISDGISITSEQFDEVKEAWIQLLKDEFGEEYTKYYFEESYDSKTIPLNISNNSRGFGLVIGLDEIFQYNLVVGCKWVCLPWGAYNYATSETVKYSLITGECSKDNVQQLRACVVDAAGTVDKSAAASNSILANGNLRFGFFPKSYNPTTYHEVWDPNITNQHKLVSYSWSH